MTLISISGWGRMCLAQQLAGTGWSVPCGVAVERGRRPFADRSEADVPCDRTSCVHKTGGLHVRWHTYLLV